MGPVQSDLGRFFDAGPGVPRDLGRALVWSEVAARAGHRLAMYNFAVMVSNGQGSAPDHAGALPWFRNAAEAGMIEAQLAFGDVYLAGRGTSRDDAEARRWFDTRIRSATMRVMASVGPPAANGTTSDRTRRILLRGGA